MQRVDDFIAPVPAPTSTDGASLAEAWEAWQRETKEMEIIAHKQGNTANQITYLPSPSEIRTNIARMRWMESVGLNDLFISSVMIFESPTFAVAERMILAYGPSEAYRRLRPFLHAT